MRQLWMQAEFKNGVTFTAGQFWSLMTTDRNGIATRSEFIPTTIEGSYVVGYSYAAPERSPHHQRLEQQGVGRV